MELEKESIDLLRNAVSRLEAGFDLPDHHEAHDVSKMGAVLETVAEKMQNNYPYFHPLFAGQMLKPPHPLAKAAYMLSMWINPNNHALDGSKASSPMEKEVVSDLARMFGMDQHLGHLTGGGTMANLEALWVAGQSHPEKKVAASEQAHYTHERISSVLKIGFEKIKTDEQGRMDMHDLEQKLTDQKIGTVVCTLGTTGLGTLDPLDKILDLQMKYNFRIHVDAAYGGYFGLIDNLAQESQLQYSLLDQVDSIVVDPHKHGLQPYGCGCVLFSDPEVAKFYLHDSPYTYFTSDELHLGEISLECSRAGAAAVALWATHQLLPPTKSGEFAQGLAKGRGAALDLYGRLAASDQFYPLMRPETDIVVWAVQGRRTSEMSEKAQQLFARAEENHLYLSIYKFPTNKLQDVPFEIDTEYLVCLRSCLMKPDHDKWMDEIWKRLEASL